MGTRLTGSDVVAEEEMEIILANDWRSLVHPTGGDGGGTTVSANPSGVSGSTLNRLRIGSTNYNIQEVQTASASLYESGSVRIQVTLAKHPEDGDIFSFEVPAAIDSSTSDLVIRTSNGDSFGTSRDALDLNGDNVTPADFTAGRHTTCQRQGNDYVVLTALSDAVAAAGTGAITLTPLTDADKNFSQSTALGSGQNNRLFDTDITLPTDIADGELFYIRAHGNIGENMIPMTKRELELLVAVQPVTWISTGTTGIAVDRDFEAVTKNAYSFPIGQNRGLLIGISNETPFKLQWGCTNTTIEVSLQIVTVESSAAEGGQQSPEARAWRNSRRARCRPLCINGSMMS